MDKQQRKIYDHNRYALLTPEDKRKRNEYQREHYVIRNETKGQKERRRIYDHKRYMLLKNIKQTGLRLKNIRQTRHWWGKEN